MRDSLIGLTALLGIVGVIATLILFGEVALSKPAGYPMTLRINQADGLIPGGPITMNGVRIGKIVSIGIADDPRDGVQLELLINEGVQVPRDVRVTIARDLVGDARLSLSATRIAAADGAGDAGFVQPGETLNANAHGLIEQISGLLDSRLSAVERAADSFTELAGTYREVGQRVSAYLEPRTIEAVEAGALPSLAATLARLDRTLDQAEAWLGDPSLREDLKATVERANLTLSRIAETADEWGETARSTRAIASNVHDRVTEVSGDIRGVIARIDAAAGDMQSLMASANRGDGTVAHLLNNPDLYNALLDASKRIERAVFEAQLLLEKYRKEGIPIQF